MQLCNCVTACSVSRQCLSVSVRSERAASPLGAESRSARSSAALCAANE